MGMNNEMDNSNENDFSIDSCFIKFNKSLYLCSLVSLSCLLDCLM